MEMRILGLTAAVAMFSVWTAPAPTAHKLDGYTAQMSGSMETPPNMTKGMGTATLSLVGNELHYTIKVNGLTGPATMAHIHVGAPGVAGPPVLTFTIKKIASGTLAEESVDLTKGALKISTDSLKVLLNNGNAYVNVHTAANAGGEIRGQLAKQ